jgi:serine O-acetyltransferase
MTKYVEPGALQDDRIDLDEIVGSLRALRKRAQQNRYRNGSLPQLPSREAVVKIVDGLVAALYPRHFGPSDVFVDSVDGFLIHTLDATLRSLREQIRRELQLFAETTQVSGAGDDQRASAITSTFAHSLPKVRALLDTDICAAFDGDPAARSFDEVVFCYPGVAAVIRHRLAHELYLLGAPMLARIISEIAHSQTGIDIHPGAEIGESFFIDHGTGVVIGETARIGKSVRLYQAVTLGAKRFETDENGALVKGKPRHPILEDNVVIYAGATVLGRITIGRGSSVGGNVWLTHSVPPGSNITQAKVCVQTFDHGAGI